MSSPGAEVDGDGGASRSPSYLVWPGLVFVLLGGQIILMLVAVFLATSDGSFAIEPDYYQKGLRWDETAAQLRENQQLSWEVALAIEQFASILKEGTLTCVVTDSAGQPVIGAVVQVEAFPHVRGTERQTVTLTPRDDGSYAARLRFARKGVWEFRVTVRREEQTFTCTQQRDVYPPGESHPWQR